MKVVEKIWGSEEWIANSALYCGKRLRLNKGYRCSYHYHKIKDETFYVESGLVDLRVEGMNITLGPGDKFHIPPGTKHSFEGLADSVIFEFSTQHFDSDSYRDDQSCKVE